MSCAELLQAIPKRNDSLTRGANDHAEEAILEEALRWESQAVLFVQKFLAEFDVIGNSLELVEVDAHHHVHGSAASDGSYTSDGG